MFGVLWKCFSNSVKFIFNWHVLRKLQMVLETESIKEGLGYSEDIVCTFDLTVCTMYKFFYYTVGTGTAVGYCTYYNFQ